MEDTDDPGVLAPSVADSPDAIWLQYGDLEHDDDGCSAGDRLRHNALVRATKEAPR